ncbi:hypothetical protein JKP88DRAFT_264828 [Tribonema minus]|uniref:Uncharacterized protein n=1 Tax=Tribonema minus TaxID=303371 RepID=A0A835YM24_9STRA|nr:hypothetical protein JKP88DRAFT_264828 [Tribonema minus]
MPEPLLIAPKTAIVRNSMDSCSARSTAPTEQVATAAQPDSAEHEPPALCAGTPSKPPVEVKTVNLWDAREREEHAVAYFAYTYRLAEERRAAKRAAEGAKEQVSNMPEPLLIAPKTAIVRNNMDSCSARSTAPTEQVATAAQPDSAEPEPPALCAGTPSKPPVEVKTVNLWDVREREEHAVAYFAYTQRLAEERRAAKRAAETAKEQASNRPQPLPAAPTEAAAPTSTSDFSTTSSAMRVAGLAMQTVHTVDEHAQVPEQSMKPAMLLPRGALLTVGATMTAHDGVAHTATNVSDTSKPPVEVKTVNLWDVREREEHAVAYFAYTQRLAEERRAAKRAAETAKEQATNRPQPLPAAPTEAAAPTSTSDFSITSSAMRVAGLAMQTVHTVDEHAQVPEQSMKPAMLLPRGALLTVGATMTAHDGVAHTATNVSDTNALELSSALINAPHQLSSAPINAPEQPLVTAAQSHKAKSKPTVTSAVRKSTNLPPEVKNVTLNDMMMQFTRWGYDINDQVDPQCTFVYQQIAQKTRRFECKLLLKNGQSTPPYIEVWCGNIVPPAQQTSFTAEAGGFKSALNVALQSAPSVQPDTVEEVLRLAYDDMKWCNQCQHMKPLTSFCKDKTHNDGLQTSCKDCNRARISTRTGFICGLVAASKQRSKQRGMNQNALTATVFDGICSAQRDRCVYSGLPVTFAPMSDWQASIERIRDDEDYTVANSALSALEFNVRAGWTVAKARYAATHTDRVDTAIVEAVAREALSKPTNQHRAARPWQQKEEDGATLTLCTSCAAWKLQEDFYASSRTICKECMCNAVKRFESTWRGAFKRLVKNATAHCKLPTRAARGLVCSITFEDLVDMYSEQGGACCYSRIPVTIEGDWKLSLERKDVHVGYSRENCCIIAMEFQSADFTATSKYGGDGCAAWSAIKYNYFRANYDPANVPTTRGNDSC